jgi:hypothetical protein
MRPDCSIEDAVDVGGPHARGVDVLDAEQKAAASRPGLLESQQGRQCVPQMQFAVGAGRETEDWPIRHRAVQPPTPVGLTLETGYMWTEDRRSTAGARRTKS